MVLANRSTVGRLRSPEAPLPRSNWSGARTTGGQPRSLEYWRQAWPYCRCVATGGFALQSHPPFAGPGLSCHRNSTIPIAFRSADGKLGPSTKADKAQQLFGSVELGRSGLCAVQSGHIAHCTVRDAAAALDCQNVSGSLDSSQRAAPPAPAPPAHSREPIEQSAATSGPHVGLSVSERVCHCSLRCHGHCIAVCMRKATL